MVYFISDFDQITIKLSAFISNYFGKEKLVSFAMRTKKKWLILVQINAALRLFQVCQTFLADIEFSSLFLFVFFSCEFYLFCILPKKCRCYDVWYSQMNSRSIQKCVSSVCFSHWKAKLLIIHKFIRSTYHKNWQVPSKSSRNINKNTYELVYASVSAPDTHRRERERCVTLRNFTLLPN